MLHTTLQVANAFHVSDQTVRNWVESGMLKAYKQGQRALRFTSEEVNRFAAEHPSMIYSPHLLAEK